MEHEVDGGTNNCWCTRNYPKRVGKKIEEIENKSRYHLDDSIAKIDSNDQKTPGDLRRLAVIQTCIKRPSANAGGKKLRSNEQVVYAQAGTRPREWDAQNSLGFWDTNGRPDLMIVIKRKKKWTRQLVDLTIPADYGVKWKGEKWDKYWKSEDK